MTCFTKTTTLFLSVFCLFLIFIPKVNLITFAGRETAGIRLDDVVLLSSSFLIFWGHISTRRPLLNIEKIMFAIVGFSLFSYFLNRVFVTTEILHVDASILYAMRIFEYFIFFYVGYYAARHFDLDKIVWSLLLLNAGLMIAQKLGMIGYFSNYGYDPSNTFRCCGISAFPSEMGLVLNMLFCYLLVKTAEYTDRAIKFFGNHAYIAQLFSVVYPIILFAGFTLLIAINGSRIAMAAQFFVFAVYMIKCFSFRSIAICSVILLVLGFMFVGKNQTEISTVTVRAKNLMRIENIELIQEVWKEIDTNLDPIGNEVVWYDGSSQDQSWWMRIHKWAYALKIYVEHPESYLQGIGPGFATAGLDGGVLRILVEYGILGSLLFIVLFRMIASQSLILGLSVLVFMINMVFFDAYLAYKPMSLLFLFTGFRYAE